MLKNVKGQIVSGFAVATAFIGQAHAAVPAAITTALEDAGTDGVTVATAILVAIVAIYAFKLMRRAL